MLSNATAKKIDEGKAGIIIFLEFLGQIFLELTSIGNTWKED